MQDAREANRPHGQVAAEENLAGDLIVLTSALEAGEAEGELRRLGDVEADECVVTLRTEV